MRLTTVALLLVTSTMPLAAQQWQWPEKAKNLKVLPPTTSAAELRRTMQNFTNALGVRCSYCHVGEEGKSLAEFDFPSDNKPEKDKARTMLTMVKAINTQYLVELPGHDASSVSVSCITCHRGNAIPIMLEDKLKRTYDRKGIDSTIQQYRTLREKYYGGFTYNFKEGTLLRLADMILADTAGTSDAIRILKLNIELYPAFPFSYLHLATIHEGRGNIPAAIDDLRMALSLTPQDERIAKQLERLESKK